MKLRIKSVICNIGKQKTANHKKNKSTKSKDSVISLWDNFKRSNIHIIEVPEGEEKEQEIEKLFEKIMKEHFPNLVKEIDIQVQKAQRVPNKMESFKQDSPNKSKIQHNKIPKVKGKERILKASREKQLVTYRGVPIRLSAGFSKETLQARKYWQEIFQVMKSRDL